MMCTATTLTACERGRCLTIKTWRALSWGNFYGPDALPRHRMRLRLRPRGLGECRVCAGTK